MYTGVAKSPGIPLLFSVSRCMRCSTPYSSSMAASFSGGYDHVGQGTGNFSCASRPGSHSYALCKSRGFVSHKNPLGMRKVGNLGPLAPGSFSCENFSSAPKYRKPSIGFHLKGLGNVYGIRTRNFSADATSRKTRVSGKSETTGKMLPWIAAAYNGRKVKVSNKKVATRGAERSSSWEESASRYFSKEGNDKPAAMKHLDSSGPTEKFGSRRDIYVRQYDDPRVDDNMHEDDEPIDNPKWDKINNSRPISREARYERPEVARWSKQQSWGQKTWREATVSTVPKIVGESVYGVGPILAALSVGRRDFYALYVQEGLDLNANNKKKKRKDKKGIEKIFKKAEEMGLTVKEASKHDLNMIVDNRPHQGLVLDASPLEMVNIKELDPVSLSQGGKAPLWVALDEVTDPQNLGAIVRSSYFFGVKGVVVCAKNSAPLSGVVSKASAGSLELIELRSCKNMMQFLSSSVENGWRVLGGSVSSKAVSLAEVQPGLPTIIVLGSEGRGLRPLVERSCTQLIKIPGNIPLNLDVHTEEEETMEGEELEMNCLGQEFNSFLAVESLNVSVAAGVLLYHLNGNSSGVATENHIVANQ